MVETYVMSDDEWNVMVEEACQFHMGISLAQFKAAYRQGLVDWDEPLAATTILMFVGDDLGAG